jgi:hypothetical protein
VLAVFYTATRSFQVARHASILLQLTLVRGVRPEGGSSQPTYKKGFGYHPLLVYRDETGEALAGRLRPGSAGANNGLPPLDRTPLYAASWLSQDSSNS